MRRQNLCSNVSLKWKDLSYRTMKNCYNTHIDITSGNPTDPKHWRGHVLRLRKRPEEESETCLSLTPFTPGFYIHKALQSQEPDSDLSAHKPMRHSQANELLTTIGSFWESVQQCKWTRVLKHDQTDSGVHSLCPLSWKEENEAVTRAQPRTGTELSICSQLKPGPEIYTVEVCYLE